MNHRLLLPSLLVAFFLILCSSPRLQAGRVTLSFTQGSKTLATYDFGGTPLADGSIIRIGTFADGLGTNRSILESSDDFSLLDSIFTPLAEGNAGAGSIVQAQPVAPLNPLDSTVVNGTGQIDLDPGSAFGQIANTTTGYLAEGTRLYVWAFNGNDVTSVTPGDWGIYTSTDLSWAMPNDIPLDPNEWAFITGLDPILALRGTVLASELQFGIVPVPEPAAAILLGVSGLLALRRRR